MGKKSIMVIIPNLPKTDAAVLISHNASEQHCLKRILGNENGGSCLLPWEKKVIPLSVLIGADKHGSIRYCKGAKWLHAFHNRAAKTAPAGTSK